MGGGAKDVDGLDNTLSSTSSTNGIEGREGRVEFEYTGREPVPTDVTWSISRMLYITKYYMSIFSY